MSILALVLVGLATSLAVSVVVPANEPRALLMTMAVGVAGALMGALLCVTLGISTDASGLYPQTTAAAALGALGLIVVYHRLSDGVRFRL